MATAARALRWFLVLLGLGTLCYLHLETHLNPKISLKRFSVSSSVLTFQNSLSSALRNVSAREQTLEVTLKSETDGGKRSSLQNASLLNTSSAKSLDRPKNDSTVGLEIFKSLLNTSSMHSLGRPKNDSTVGLEIFKSLLNTSSMHSLGRPKNDSTNGLEIFKSLLNTSSTNSLGRPKKDSTNGLEIFKSLLNTSSIHSLGRPKNDSTVGLEIFKSLLNTSSTNSLGRHTNDSNVVLTTLKPEAPASGHGVRPEKCRKCFLTDFPELISNDAVCKTEKNYTLDLVMLVLTTHSAVERRQAIRQTWASLTQNNTATKLRHVFLLGRSRDAGHMRSVQEEQAKYSDIVMHDYIDSYGNLTLKTLSGFHWLLKHCPNVRFFLKVDDDVWVNVPTLLNLLQSKDTELQTAIGGSCFYKVEPIRNSASKWYASFKSYPHPLYPSYCSGTAYTSSLNVARNVVRVSPHIPFFHLEDVYVALCMREYGGNFILNLEGFTHEHGNACVLRAPETVTVHRVSANKLLKIWSAKCP